jgi:membrane associated rhomboid family serine protease
MLPPVGPMLRKILIVLFATWLIFALALNWGGASGNSFLSLSGNNNAIANGEIWRLFTALLLHAPSGEIGHIVSAMLGLYFLGSSLEEVWGGKRFLRFLIAAGVLSYLTQFLVGSLLPTELGTKLVPENYFGAIPAVEAVAIAWACSFRGRTILLFFVVPVSSRGLILMVVGFSLMSLIAGGMSPSGHIALFAGMGYGWLLGGGSPTPLRRFILKQRLAALEREAQNERHQKKRRAKESGLRVIRGGKDEDEPPDKKLMN